MEYRTLIFATWTDIPSPYRSDCMERVGEGAYRHHRLGILFVCLDEANKRETVEHLIGDCIGHARRPA